MRFHLMNSDSNQAFALVGFSRPIVCHRLQPVGGVGVNRASRLQPGFSTWIYQLQFGFVFQLTILICCLVTLRTVSAQNLDFNRDIRPILSDKCFRCHGPDANARQADLRLDSRTGLFSERDGIKPIIPGKPNNSEAIQRILSKDPDLHMPPADSKKTLTKQQIAKLVKWVEQGAPWKRHWSFEPPRMAKLPSVKREDWPRNAIDYFILARQEPAALSPSPEANPFKLVRRLYLDLIGLPPTPEEADKWIARLVDDDRIDEKVYDELVDHLLDSKHYGERWARRWLDLARYADTNGYEKDRDRSIWPYRDWVIKALNADMPFDQFTIEQIAGDMLPNATIEQRIATGFHRNTMLNEEGGIDPLEFRFHAMTDRVATTGTTWLGLTIGCGQCHSHKYDPISQQEYYQFMAFLNNADEPDLDLPDAEVDTKYASNLNRAETLLGDLAEKWPVDEIRWETPKPESIASESQTKARVLKDRSVLFAAPNQKIDVYTVRFNTTASKIDRIRLEALPHSSLPKSGPGHGTNGEFSLSQFSVTVAPINSDDDSVTVRITKAEASSARDRQSITSAFDGSDETAWSPNPKEKRGTNRHSAIFRIETPIGFEGGTRFSVSLVQSSGQSQTIGRLRLSLGTAFDRPIAERRREIVEREFAGWLDRERQRTARWVPLRPSKVTANLPLLTIEDDDSVFASGDTAKVDTYELLYPVSQSGITAIRLEALPDERLPAHGPGSTYYEGTKGDFFLGEFQIQVDGKPIRLSRASHNYAKNRFGNNPVSAALAIDGDLQTGWSVDGRQGERHTAVFVTEQPIKQAKKLRLKMVFGRHFPSSLGRFRISVTTRKDGAEARDFSTAVEELLLLPDEKLAPAERKRLKVEFLLQAAELAQHAKTIRELRKRPKFTTTLVMSERPRQNPRPTHLHKRGEFLLPTEKVEPATPAALNAFPPNVPRNRLGFARWLVSPENPLTARVVVNRHWSAFFGRGIVATSEDFGLQGDPPTHPKLLDWLAIDFVKQGWSLKRLHKTIVMSATYRQSSKMRAESDGDPGNRLLTRMPRFRLEAEIMRDATLQAAGLLSTKAGGPPVRPAQPAGVTEVAWGSPAWNVSQGEDRHRRSIYTFIKRTAPFAMFNTFDAPSGEACIARRDVSNTALQALTLLNDVMFIEAARAMGRELSQRDGNDIAKVTYCFRRLLTRPPSEYEVSRLIRFVKTQRQRFESKELNAETVTGTKSETSIEHATWTTLVRAMFGLDEAITRN